jgi:hypothetical protein
MVCGVLEPGTGLVIMLGDRFMLCRVSYINPITKTDCARTEIMVKDKPAQYF